MKERPWLIIIAIAVVAWGAGLTLGFFLDDLNNLEQALAAPLTFDGLAQGFTVFDPASIEVWALDREAVRFFRPLFVLSLKLDHLVWGLNPFGFHLTNLLLHILNALLVYRFLRLVEVDSRIALFTGMLFAGYPHHTVAILWVSGRTELLMATFVIAALVAHMESRQRACWWLWRIGALLASACAFLTKEGAVVLAPLLVLSEWLVRGPGERFAEVVKRMTLRLWPYMAMTALYLVYRFAVFGLGEHPPMPYYVSPSEPLFPLYLAVKTVYYYLCWLMALPIMPVAPVAFLLDHWWAAAGAALIVFAGWGMVMWKLRAQRGAFVWLLWSVAALAPTAPVMTSNHYTYIANVGVALLAVCFIVQMPLKRRKVQIGFAVLVCVLHATFGVINYRNLESANVQLADKVVDAAPDILEGEADLYLVNLPFAAAHTGQRLRVLHGARDLRTHLLTVSSEPFEIGPPPRVEWHGPRALTMHLPDEWLDSELVKMFLMMTGDIVPNRHYPSGPATLTTLATRSDRVDAFEMKWPDTADPARQFIMEIRPGAEEGEVEADVVRLMQQGR